MLSLVLQFGEQLLASELVRRLPLYTAVAFACGLRQFCANSAICGNTLCGYLLYYKVQTMMILFRMRNSSDFVFHDDIEYVRHLLDIAGASISLSHTHMTLSHFIRFEFCRIPIKTPCLLYTSTLLLLLCIRIVFNFCEPFTRLSILWHRYLFDRFHHFNAHENTHSHPSSSVCM